MARRTYEVVGRIGHRDSKGRPRDFEVGEQVTWRDFDDDEAQGTKYLHDAFRSGALRERDLDAEEIAMVGMKGPWRPLEKLGAGGQGTVFKALNSKRADLPGAAALLYKGLFEFRDPSSMKGDRDQLSREIQRALDVFVNAHDPANLGALKTLHASGDLKADHKARVRMKNEVKAYQSISNTSLLRILDADIEQGWIVTEYQPHGTLEGVIGEFHGEVLRVLDMLGPLIEAMSQLHAKGAVHRDIKPANVFLGADRRLILGDAGLAFFLEDGGRPRPSETLENVGSHDWMPLYAQGQRWEDVSPAFDVFSLGKLMWAMVAGRSKIPDQVYGLNKALELEKLFPGHEPARLLAELLRRVLVANESEQQLKNASDLEVAVLDLVDQLRTSKCQACMTGSYGKEKDLGNGPFGRMAWRVCTSCHHVRFFERG